jgi:hypothetical protein
VVVQAFLDWPVDCPEIAARILLYSCKIVEDKVVVKVFYRLTSCMPEIASYIFCFDEHDIVVEEKQEFWIE